MSLLRPCPICQSSAEDAVLFQEEYIDKNRISDFSYASRKEPEYMCHRLVCCNTCQLVYVSHPPLQQELTEAYHVAQYDSSEEASDAAEAYIRAMRPILLCLQQKHSALDIGSGTGVLLELLQQQGFVNLIGVEPSSAAILAAPAHRRDWLKEGIFEEHDFKSASFDLICCFMTMEHVRDPMIIASAVSRLLRPGGAFVTVTHDYRSVVNRMMGRKSPIIDIEHMQLFSKNSIRELFERVGFVDVKSKAFINRYALAYWVRLFPLPKSIKTSLMRFLIYFRLDRLRISLPVGNTMTSGFKPK